MMRPSSIEELSQKLQDCHREGRPAGAISLEHMASLMDHQPEDMTTTVQAGMTLAALQQELAKQGQWLPLDPPGGATMTLRELLDSNRSGPRRCGYGTVRDWVIGMKAVLADGRVIQSGGKVVKNVAGFDLHKLLIGARGELGVIAEVTFKVSPIPASELILTTCCSDLEEAGNLLRSIVESPVNPVILDLHRSREGELKFTIAFAGTEAETRWQSETIRSFADWTEGNLNYCEDFHSLLNGNEPPRDSVLPSKLIGVLQSLGKEPFLARAGNGIVYRSHPAVHPNKRSILEDRVRSLFDPKGVFISNPQSAA